MTHFYTYWEGSNCPTYVELCVATWYNHIPDLELTVINHSNLFEWVGDVYNIEKLLSFSLPMQSDAVSAAVLAKFGGTFIDADTVMVSDPRISFLDQGTDRFTAFGIPSSKRFHVAVLHTGSPGNSIALQWMHHAAVRIDARPSSVGWDYLSGQILHPLLDDPHYETNFNIIDRKLSGNILESVFELAPGQGKRAYEMLYFEPNGISLEKAVASVKEGLISLHNSWTPSSYAAIESAEDVFEYDSLLSRILEEFSPPDVINYLKLGRSFLR